MQQDMVGDKASAQKARFGLSMTNVRYHSQLVAYPYFLVSAILFLLQIVFGGIIASQYLWPTFLLLDSFAFNVGRETHRNLLIFWLLLGLMGAACYLIPEETDSDI